MKLADLILQIRVSGRAGDLVILAGAGVSRDAPSSLPLWDDLNRAVIDGFCLPHLTPAWIPEVRRLALSLRPEVVLQLGLDTFGRDVLQVLDRLRSTAFNENHLRILSLSAGRNPIVTTNLDQLFEHAAGQIGRELVVCVSDAEFAASCRAGLRGPLLKVHGSVSHDLSSIDSPSLVASLDQVGSGFSALRRRTLSAFLDGKTLLVLGYHGADHFDLMPLLQEVAPKLGSAVWVNHATGDPTLLDASDCRAALHPLARQFLARVPASYVIVGQTRAVLKRLTGAAIVALGDPGDVAGVPVAPPTVDHPSARAALMVGNMCEVIGQPAIGAAWLSELLAAGPPMPGPLEGELISLQGRLLEDAGDIDGATRALASVDVGVLSAGSRVRHGIRRGNLENRRGNPNAARAAYLQALALAPAGTVLHHACLHALGVCLIFEGRAADAVAHYRSFLPQMYRRGDVRTRLAALNNLGAAYYLCGRPRMAERWLELALVDAEFVNYPSRRANILDALGLVTLDVGAPTRAVQYLNSARRIRNEVGAPLERSISLVNLGDAFLAAGRYEAALSAHRAASHIRSNEMAGQGSAIAIMGIGRALALLGRTAEVADILALPTTEPTSEVERTRGRLHRALLLLHLNRTVEAMTLLRSMHRLTQALQNVIAAVLRRAANPRCLERGLMTAGQMAALRQKLGERAELIIHLELIRAQHRLAVERQLAPGG